MDKKTIIEKYRTGDLLARGRMYGIKHAIPKMALGIAAFSGVVMAGIWACTEFIGLQFQQNRFLAIGLPVFSLIGIVAVCLLAVYAVATVQTKASLWHWKKYLVVQRGFFNSTIRVVSLDTIQVCDVDAYTMAGQRGRKLYRLRAHMNNGRFEYLLYTDDIRIRVKELARKINGMVAVHTGCLTHMSQSKAGAPTRGEQTIDQQKEVEDASVELVPISVGDSNFVMANGPLSYIDEKGNVRQTNVAAIVWAGFLIIGVIGLLIGGFYWTQNKLRSHFWRAQQHGDISTIELYETFGYQLQFELALKGAIERNDGIYLKYLLGRGADPNTRVEYSIQKKLSDSELLARKLLSRDRIFTSQRQFERGDYRDEIPLLALAALKDNATLVDLLLSEGANPNAEAKQGKGIWQLYYGEEPAMIVNNRWKLPWEFAQSDLLKYRLRAAAEQWPKLLEMAFIGDDDALKQYLAENESPPLKLKNGMSLLAFAITQDNVNAVKRLAGTGLFVQNDILSFLLDAVDTGEDEMAIALLGAITGLNKTVQATDLPKRLQETVAEYDGAQKKEAKGKKKRKREKKQPLAKTLGQFLLAYKKNSPAVQAEIKKHETVLSGAATALTASVHGLSLHQKVNKSTAEILAEQKNCPFAPGAVCHPNPEPILQLLMSTPHGSCTVSSSKGKSGVGLKKKQRVYIELTKGDFKAGNLLAPIQEELGKRILFCYPNRRKQICFDDSIIVTLTGRMNSADFDITINSPKQKETAFKKCIHRAFKKTVATRWPQNKRSTVAFNCEILFHHF